MGPSVTVLAPTRPPIRWRNVLRRARGPLVVSVAYFLGAEAAFLIGTLSDNIFAPFWPPNVVLFCALLFVPERRWWLYIAAVFPAHAVAEIGVGMPALPLLVAFVTNCLVALGSAFAVRRLVGGPPWFGDLRKAAMYVLITAGVSPALVALGGAFVPILSGGPLRGYWLYVTYWYAANALPSLTIGPIVLMWLSEGLALPSLKAPWRKLEAACLGAALVTVCALAFEASAGKVAPGFLPTILYSPLPLILWATVRFGSRGACMAILVVTTVLIGRALKGPSLFLGADPETNVLALQIFLISLSIPMLLLGAAIDDLHHAEQTMRRLAGSVLTAQDEERRRIARELHDSTGQNLIAAGMLVQRMGGLVPDPSRPMIKQLDDLVQQSIQELRTMSYLLHPPLLDEAGLQLALQHYVDGFGRRSGLVIELDIAPQLGRMAPEVELALFRVVQEALTNVSRHSGSATARIRLAPLAHGPGVILTVEDAGKGLSANPGPFAIARRGRSRTGVGLASMRERLHQIGGRLEIEFGPRGTVVTAIVPERDAA